MIGLCVIAFGSAINALKPSAEHTVSILAIALSYFYSIPVGFTRDDVINTTEKLWQLHTDPICGIDGAAAILATIQYNLCAGTIAPYATQHIEVSKTLERVLSFEVS